MDHERVNVSQSSMSCGVMELSRIDSDLEGVCYALASRLYHPSRGSPCAFFIWSDVVEGGEKLADFVNRSEFGGVMRSGVAENPKTGNMIRIWIWSINHLDFKAWYSKERSEKMKKVGT